MHTIGRPQSYDNANIPYAEGETGDFMCSWVNCGKQAEEPV